MEGDFSVCRNCKRHVVSANFTLHEAYCLRFLVLCPECEEPVPKETMEEHCKLEHQQAYGSGIGKRFWFQERLAVLLRSVKRGCEKGRSWKAVRWSPVSRLSMSIPPGAPDLSLWRYSSSGSRCQLRLV
ncbi:XIAP associated factor 1 [Homo sapiens]|uniref:XIAP associated factor 1 n=1 Tax=Homo sapiens TaxID=9606 RepID=I3L534_HUMAN|nr:XIAP associated factor 1 [Homo sapiens]KAI2580925.1 XIAP associated factor 1 [Homo sapiens]KAI4047426.1 XIAP associated factor 1 [Homo sapiens]KAI4047435.1 XIAP associated factor 1 [Homo sapiens]